MLKNKYIAGIIAIVFAIILGGCVAPADLPERTAKADAIRQTPLPGDERDSGPVIVTLSTEEEIEWAICSEGCLLLLQWQSLRVSGGGREGDSTLHIQ